MSTEPIYYTVSSRFLFLPTQGEKDFMVSLCDRLGLNEFDKNNIDSMKDAVLGFLTNQVEDWMKITDNQQLDEIIDTNFKLLCEAQSFLTTREGTRQTQWEEVLLNHVKLISTFNHILMLNK